MADEPAYHTQRWTKHFEGIDNEIAQLRQGLPGAAAGPRRDRARAAQRQRWSAATRTSAPSTSCAQLLMMHYSVRDKALVAIGEQETMAIIGDIVERCASASGE